MRPILFTKTLAAADDDNIALSQAVAGAGDLTINGAAAAGGVATLDSTRQVIITSAGNDSGITFTAYGTVGGVPQQRSVAGAAVGIAVVPDYFDTVTRVAASGAAAGNVKVGTNGVGATPWYALDQYIDFNQVNIVGEVYSGSVNWSVEMTDDPILDQDYMLTNTPVAFLHPVLQAQAGNYMGQVDSPVAAVRFVINSGTGVLRGRIRQAGWGT